MVIPKTELQVKEGGGEIVKTMPIPEMKIEYQVDQLHTFSTKKDANRFVQILGADVAELVLPIHQCHISYQCRT